MRGSACLGLQNQSLRFRLQTVQNIQHRWSNVSVVMDNLPGSGLSAIDVGNPMVDCDLLSGKRDLPALDTEFVGGITGDLNHLIIQFDLPP